MGRASAVEIGAIRMIPSYQFTSREETAQAGVFCPELSDRLCADGPRNLADRRTAVCVIKRRFLEPLMNRYDVDAYRLAGTPSLPLGCSVSAHLAMISATCASSRLYMWSPPSTITVFTRLGPLD